MSIRCCVAVIGVVAGIAACSNKATGPGLASSTVFYRVDGNTCAGSSPFHFFIDAVLVGTETLSAGKTSRGYGTTESTHTLVARVVPDNPSWVWTANVNLAGLGVDTFDLGCAATTLP